MTGAPPTKRIGLIGDPVAQSLSPAFQQPAFDALGLKIRYELWHTSHDEVPARLEEIRNGLAIGANVTVPHKELVCTLVDRLSDRARRAGAVNTVSCDESELVGDNTDIHGFIVPLTERSFDFGRSRAVILGAGGAARGVAVGLLDAGIRSLTILNRTEARAAAIATTLNDERITTSPLTRFAEQATGADLLVNATSIGWFDASFPIVPEQFEILANDSIAYDLTYRDTPFLGMARDAGLVTIDGLAMLVHQGAKAFEIWTGQPAPVDLMWQCAVEARKQRGG